MDTFCRNLQEEKARKSKMPQTPKGALAYNNLSIVRYLNDNIFKNTAKAIRNF
jgi:hypothetical protein